jgi:hypothetical protein
MERSGVRMAYGPSKGFYFDIIQKLTELEPRAFLSKEMA